MPSKVISHTYLSFVLTGLGRFEVSDVARNIKIREGSDVDTSGAKV